MKSRATSFATLKDLRGYIECRDNGGSQTFCLNKGDNGEGMWGDNTAQLDVAMVAIPTSEMKKKWGSIKAARGRIVRLRLLGAGHKKWFNAECRDAGPIGVIDLNPAALVAAGLPSDTELSTTAEWEWA